MKPDFDYLARGLSSSPGDQADIESALREAYAAGYKQGFNRGMDRAAEIAHAVMDRHAPSQDSYYSNGWRNAAGDCIVYIRAEQDAPQ